MGFEPRIDADVDIDDALCVIVHGHDVALAGGDRLPSLPTAIALGAAPEEVVYLGLLDGEPVVTCSVPADAQLPDGLVAVGLREAYQILGDELWGVVGRGVQLVHWRTDHRFCGRCGGPNDPDPGHRGLRCAACGHIAFPRVAPCAIVLVERGDRVLLGHGTRFPRPFFSCLAGFVEPGESVEETVRREVLEEAGIEVGEVRYLGSQPWPFPHNLMLAFRAAWVSGEIQVDPEELHEARWVARDELDDLLIPPPLSIARQMIDHWREEAP